LQKKTVQAPKGYIRIEKYNKLLKDVERLELIIEQLQGRLSLLEAENTELKSRLNKNSSNSSKPPSSDGYKKVIKNNREKSDRKQGAQPGHKGTTLQMTDTPDKVVINRAEGLCSCGNHIEHQTLVDIIKRQVVDLPVKLVEWTEYQVEVRQCGCGQKHYGSLAHLAPVQYGNKLKSLAVYLNQQQFVPYDRLQEIFSDLFGVSISDKVLLKANETCYENLAETEGLIVEALLQGSVMHNDETGIRCAKKLKWVHVSSNNRYTHYAINDKRGKEAIDAIGILPNYKGTSVHDRFSSYTGYDCLHALCNTHLVRELKYQGEEKAKAWAFQMIDILLMGKKLKDENRLTPAKQKELLGFYDELLEKSIPDEVALLPAALPNKRGRKPKGKSLALLEAFRDRKDEVWRFLTHLEVPFDNNLAERDLRMIKLKQKISGTFRTQHGAEVFCRIRGYISTARKQGFRVLDAINSAMQGSAVAFS